jgi:hypothetical protein
MTRTAKLATIASSFGSEQVLSSFLSQPDLNVITAFPGPVAVLSVGNLINPDGDPDDLDLVSLDYIPGSTYSVLSSDYRFLFSGQTDRYFGGSDREQNLASSALHGSYFYISFQAQHNRPVVVLVWLAREASQATKATTLTSIRSAAATKEVTSRPFSLFVATQNSNLDKERQLLILLRNGNWQQPPTIAQLFADPETRRLSLIANQGRMLQSIQDTWLAVVELDTTTVQPTISSTWQLAQTKGIGLERLLKNSNRAVFVAGESFTRLSLDPEQQGSYQASRLSAAAYFEFAS